MTSLLDMIVGTKNDPAALAAGIEKYVSQEIATAKADMQAFITQVVAGLKDVLAQANTDAAAREAQLFAGVTQAIGDVKNVVTPFADLAGRLDGAKIVVQLGDKK